MVPRKRTIVVSPIPSWERQHSSGLRIKGVEGPLRLDAEQISIQPDSRSLCQSQCRSVCVPFDVPASTFLQLEARSVSGSSRRLLQDWMEPSGYANPPWSLIGRVLASVERQAAEVVLVAPIWPSQPWYPKLLSLLVAVPCKISLRIDLIWETRKGSLPEIKPHLAVWHISGNTTLTKSF